MTSYNSLPLATRLQVEAGVARRPVLPASTVASTHSDQIGYNGLPSDSAAAISWGHDSTDFEDVNLDPNRLLPSQSLGASLDRYQNSLAAFANRPASTPGKHGVQLNGSSQ